MAPSQLQAPVRALAATLDGDGVGDSADNCRTTANADQVDADRDGIGSGCDAVEVPTAKEQCAHLGWTRFSNPSFKSTGDCNKYVRATQGPLAASGR